VSDVPEVGPRDVLRVVERDFHREDRKQVLRLLGEYSEGSETGSARVHLAILKLSGGTVAGVMEQLAVAKCDFRDVISPAEYPEFWRIGFDGADALTQDERESLKARDRQQYDAWLTRGLTPESHPAADSD
jgi:hypothetical protein